MLERLERPLSVAVNLLVAVAVVLWLFGGGANLLRGRLGIQGTTHFSNLTVTGTVQAEQLTSTDDLTVTDKVVLSTLRHTQATAITVTDGSAFSPATTYCQITAAGTVTPTISTTGFNAGEYRVLVNSGSNTINIADSGTAKLASAWAAGQYDVLVIQFDGTNWIEISRSDN